MAVRPWENRFVDINMRDGVTVHENGTMDGKNGTRANKKPFPSNNHPNLASQKTGPTLSDGCDSSPSKSAGLQESSNTQPVKPNSKANVENPIEEANSKPGIGSRSHSNPKERNSRADKQAKKRLSLPNSGEFVLFICIFIFSCALGIMQPLQEAGKIIGWSGLTPSLLSTSGSLNVCLAEKCSKGTTCICN